MGHPAPGLGRCKEEPDPLARGQMRGFFAGRYATVLRMTPGVGFGGDGAALAEPGRGVGLSGWYGAAAEIRRFWSVAPE
jgi:hypothetical protein